MLMIQFQKRKLFYQKAFSDKSQNAIEEYATSYNLALMREAVEKYQGFPMTQQQELAVIYHQHGVMGLFNDWIFDRLSMDIHMLALFQYEKTPDFLKEALSNFGYEML